MGGLGPALGILGQALLDDAEHDLKLRVVGRGGVGQRAVLLIRLLRLEAL